VDGGIAACSIKTARTSSGKAALAHTEIPSSAKIKTTSYSKRMPLVCRKTCIPWRFWPSLSHVFKYVIKRLADHVLSTKLGLLEARDRKISWRFTQNANGSETISRRGKFVEFNEIKVGCSMKHRNEFFLHFTQKFSLFYWEINSNDFFLDENRSWRNAFHGGWLNYHCLFCTTNNKELCFTFCLFAY